MKGEFKVNEILEKIKLSSAYGMMITELSESDKELIKRAYKNGVSHVYFDTDSVKKEGNMIVVIKNMDKSVLKTIDEVASDMDQEAWREYRTGNDVILNEAWLEVKDCHAYIVIDDKIRILLFPNCYDEIIIK